MEKMQEKPPQEKTTAKELHWAIYNDRPKGWGCTKSLYFDGEWYDDDADCFCD